MSRARAFCFTINNPTDSDWDALEECQTQIPQTIKYVVYQLEQGTNHTPHVQGYIYFVHPRASISRMFPRAHIEKARGTPEQNKAYCTKEESRHPLDEDQEPEDHGPWEFGDLPKQGARTDIAEYLDAVKDGKSDYVLFNEYPEQFAKYYKATDRIRSTAMPVKKVPPHVVCLYGKTGSGKSSLVWDSFDEDQIYSVPSQSSGTQFFDGYFNQPIVLFDDYYGQIRPGELLKLLDRYPYRVQTKGSTVQWTPRMIIFTSNVHPKKWYRSNVPKEVRKAIKRRFHYVWKI